MLMEKVNSMLKNVIQKEHSILYKLDIESMQGVLSETTNTKRKKEAVVD